MPADPILRLECLETREAASATPVTATLTCDAPVAQCVRQETAPPADAGGWDVFVGDPADGTAARKPYPKDKIAVPPG